MTELKDLKVVAHRVCLDLGMFFIYIDGHDPLWCCTAKADRAYELDYKGPLFLPEVEAGNLGFDAGFNATRNNWAITKYSSVEIEDFILEQAKIAGLKVNY